jgi:predicted amidohydrolase
MMKEVKVAAVAPSSFRGEEEYKNAQAAAAYTSEAARSGAQLICFPEGYPGPCSGPMDSGGQLPRTPIEMLRESARRHGVYLACGSLEESREVAGAYYLCQKLISPQGKILANYKRCQPTLPVLNAWLYNGRSHILPGDEPMVVDTELGKVGLIICSELFVPELTRVEMLMGAEIIIDPIGGTPGRSKTGHYNSDGTVLRGSKMHIWQCTAQARASENIVYVISTANIFFAGDGWGSFIAAPEGMLATSEGGGITYATLDMDRLEYLRNNYFQDEDLQPPPDDRSSYRPLLCLPGQNRDRRPSLYSKLTDPQPDAFKYF